MKRFLSTLAASLILVMPWLSMPVYAASASIYLSPASGSLYKGDYITLTIKENSGSEPVNAVQANLSYPSSKLQFISIGSTSAFEIAAQSTGGSGSVHIGRGTLSPKTGTQAVATVRFKAIAGSGTAAVSFTSGTAVVSANTSTNILTSQPGGSYSLKTTSSGGGSSGGGSTGSSTGGSTSGSTSTTTTKKPTVRKDTKPPKISNLQVNAITYNSAKVSWKTNEAANSELLYGLNSTYGLVIVNTKRLTSHSAVLKSPLILPGISYHFKVKSTDKAGNTASSGDMSFRTKGASLVVTVLNQKDNKPIEGAKVTFADQNGLTNKQGQATINNLPLGKQVINISYRGNQSAGTVNIAKINLKGAPQTATFKISVPKTFPWLWFSLLMLLLVVAAWWLGAKSSGGGGLGNIIKRLTGGQGKKNEPEGHMLGDYVPPTQPSVITPNGSPSTVVTPQQPPSDKPLL